MSEQYESLVRAGLLFIAIFALTAIVLAVAGRMRRRPSDDTRDANAIMSSFRELYERGGLSDEEFRIIKAKLATELKGDASKADATDPTKLN
jgi:uncharacterized membrane protein